MYTYMHAHVYAFTQVHMTWFLPVAEQSYMSCNSLREGHTCQPQPLMDSNPPSNKYLDRMAELAV